MFRVLECVVQEHDYRFVLLAALVCLLGNVGLFVLLKRSIFCIQARRGHWLFVAAVAEGVAVWATHFIAMLAYDGVTPISFDVGLTILSVIIAIACFWSVFCWMGLGRSFGMPIVAEGVETQAQHQMLLDEGCPQAQGFFFGAPGLDPYYQKETAERA